MKRHKSKELVELDGFGVANRSGSVFSFVKSMTPEEKALDKEATAHLSKKCSRCGSHVPMWGFKLCEKCLVSCNKNRKVVE